MSHLPVLLHEVIDGLALTSGDVVCDCTMNGGGHARAIIPLIAPKGTYIGTDLDPSLVSRTSTELAAEFLGADIRVVHSNYKDMRAVLAAQGFKGAQALMADLGFSSWQMDDADRGFSFQGNGPLDMRYDTTQGITAYEVVNGYEEQLLADIIWKYGEERFSRRIAKQIVEARRTRKISSTGELADVVARAFPRIASRSRINPATRTFQALRIFVNDELGNLRTLLEDLPHIIAPGGRAAIISFHSLEDRMVKNAFKEMSSVHGAKIITKKPLVPSREEELTNPRSRSAKLRIITF